MEIRILQSKEYPPPPELADRLRRKIHFAGFPDRVEVVNVKDTQEARRLRFLGSPSIQIDGYDIELSRRGDPPHFGYRSYITEHGDDLVPPAGMIDAALRRVLAPRVKVLYLCTGNSCRSQMAEGWTRWFWGDLMQVHSAGIEVHGLNRRAVEVMAEVAVDISKHRSKHLNELLDIKFDHVITVCDHAQESCPVFPGKAKAVHRGFDDPPRLARGAMDSDEIMAHYRRVRDEIGNYVRVLPEELNLLELWR